MVHFRGSKVGQAAIREWRHWTSPGVVVMNGRLDWLVCDLTRRLHMPILCVGERLSNCLEAIRRHAGLRRVADRAPAVACGADRWQRGPNDGRLPPLMWEGGLARLSSALS
jgi:hypothetical protein